MNSRLSASNFNRFSESIKQFLLTVGQNNFGNKIPFLTIALPIHDFFFLFLIYKTIYLGMLYTAPEAVAIKRFFVVIPFSVIVSLRAVTNAGPRI